jgi:hypothetical protein
MSDLNEQLPSISSLDDLRTQARKLKEEGMVSLAGIRDNAFAALVGGSGTAPDPVSPAAVWQGSGGLIEAALLVRVQNKRDQGSAHPALLRRVREIRLAEDLLSREETHIPVLLAARAMQTVIASPQHTLSKTTLLCYYRIIRELYVADSPDWNAGGAKAGAAGEVSAYITAECVRAVMMLARSIRKTAEFFRRTAEFGVHMERLGSPQIPREWRNVECERAALEWYVSVAHGAAHLSLSLPLPEPNASTQRFDYEGVQAYFKTLDAELVRTFTASAADFKEALDEIDRARGIEASRDPAAAINRSESAHLLARQVISDAWENALDSSALCQKPPNALAHLGELADKFTRIAQEVRRLLDPAKRYVASVLDHELTAASQERPLWDARELAFAAGAYGALTDWRNDERLVRAARLLISAPSEDGLFPRGRPFHSMPNGLRWHTLQFEVCRAVCELLQHVDIPLSPQVTAQLLVPFQHLRPDMTDAAGQAVQGWHMEDPPVPRRPTMWVSALAVLALDKFVRMLDRKINKMVLAHFSRKQPEEIGQKLENLLYADHGRRFIAPAVSTAGDEETISREPVGITLQRMRAHILGAQLPGRHYSYLFSGVFFGPPGTGKTTLLEALARSSNVPLVEISPSDIAKSGESALEAHARATFRALSMLTRVVIIFDEFEPVLWKRDSEAGPRQRDIYTFLTPGMLPKLAQLYSAAKRKRVVYGLMTNHLEQLDPAAIRRGRFDHHVGIYAPDPVSRAGRLMLELHKTLQGDASKGGMKVALTRAQLERFDEVIKSSGDVAPVRLASKWLDPKTAPDMPGGKPYVLNGGSGKPTRSSLPEPGEAALEEERRLHTWERHVQVTTRLKELLERPERVIAVGGRSS